MKQNKPLMLKVLTYFEETARTKRAKGGAHFYDDPHFEGYNRHEVLKMKNY